ncbi:MAG: hypothetical protein Q8K75_09985 [Chlamydiales bacterium]|nr:hypothetical protein [Chlamydiales bacterium]
MTFRFNLFTAAAILSTLFHIAEASVFNDGTVQTQRTESVEGTSIFDEETRDFWEVAGYGNSIRRSNFRTPGFEGQQISYFESQLMITYNHFFDQCNAISFGGAFGSNGINWRESPAINKNTFNTGSVTLGGYSKQYQRWLWRANFTARFSLDERVPTYVLYTSALWGRYDLTCRFGTHVGYFFETGMRKDKVWPILGFDYEFSDCLKLYAVYPFEVSLHYDVCRPWAIEISSRFFRYRDRMGDAQPDPRGLIEYRNTGAEFRLVYDWFPAIKGNIHAGYTFGGDLRVTDRRDNNAIHYKFDPAPYFGGEFNLKF